MHRPYVSKQYSTIKSVQSPLFQLLKFKINWIVHLVLWKYITLLTVFCSPARSTPSVTETINVVTSITFIVTRLFTFLSIESFTTFWKKKSIVFLNVCLQCPLMLKITFNYFSFGRVMIFTSIAERTLLLAWGIQSVYNPDL